MQRHRGMQLPAHTGEVKSAYIAGRSGVDPSSPAIWVDVPRGAFPALKMSLRVFFFLVLFSFLIEIAPPLSTPRSATSSQRLQPYVLTLTWMALLD